MALDAQSNWDVEMPQLKTPIKSIDEKSSSPPTPPLVPPTHEILLPSEIISNILSFIPQTPATQRTLWACTLVSRSWYASTVERLYSKPQLSGGNFAEFVATICPSKNAHIRHSALSPLVRRLDMGELVHNASKSLTARLLGRLKGNIEEFIAPQSSFAINSFAALSKCTKLRYLDLSLISASISNRLLFQTLGHLADLETLFFPRSSSHDESRGKEEAYEWPPKLEALHLAGGVNDQFLLRHLRSVPPTLSRLSIQHCSQIYIHALNTTLKDLGPQLQHLTIRHPMPQLSTGYLDQILILCPNLLALRTSADYISNGLFCYPTDTLSPLLLPADDLPSLSHLDFHIDTDMPLPSPTNPHPLRILDIECSAHATADVEISASTIYDAVDDGIFPDLRSIRISARLAWAATERSRVDATDLEELLEENEMERPLGVTTSVRWSMPD